VELHRIIFRVDYPPAFKLLNRWGDAFELLRANKFWTNLAEAREIRRIIATRKEIEKGIDHNLFLELNNISGIIEEHPISSLEPFMNAFGDATQLVHLIEATSFLRVGVRFVFLEESESFDVPLRALSAQVRNEYWESFEGELIDIALTSVHKIEDQKIRVNAGPIAKREYSNWFNLPEKIKIENGFILDIDCFASEYKFKTFDLRKFIDFNYTIAKKHSLDLLRFIKK
jgi:hypothetical protein